MLSRCAIGGASRVVLQCSVTHCFPPPVGLPVDARVSVDRPRSRPISPVRTEKAALPRDVLLTLPTGDAVSVETVAKQLAGLATATRAQALGAHALGYDARVVVVKSDIDTRVLINPEVTAMSQATTTAWDADGDMVHRVLRPRNVSVKYTTLDGDNGELLDLTTSESLWLQRVLDELDGIHPTERLSPCVAPEPELFPTLVSGGLIASVPRAHFEHHRGHLLRLTDSGTVITCSDALETIAPF